MFRIHQTTSTLALRHLRSTIRSTRLFHAASPAGALGNRGPKIDFSKLKDVPESAEALSSYLDKAYSAVGSHRRAQADNKRVNIVSRKLCDDIIKRMKPSLLKHIGCDIIDINPGAGIWSSAVHDFLKPRNHYLMEADNELYTPLLQPLLDAEGSTYKLIPKSGAVWGHLNNLLTPANLPQQEEYKAGDPRLDKPNDTLLVLANLGWYPRKPYRSFPSISMLVVHQLLSAVRAHSLFHRYGLIRMLVWVPDEEGKRILPRSINPRRKMAIEAEISCSNIFEIASSTAESGPWRRDEHLNLESSRKVLKRMEEAGVTTPDGRRLQEVESRQERNSGDDLSIHREWKVELQQLEDQLAAGEISKYVGGVEKVGSAVSPEWKRWKHLKTYKENKKSAGKELSAKLTAELEKLDSRVAAGTLKRYRDPKLNTSQVELGPQHKTIRDRSSLPKTSEYKRLVYLRQRLSADRGRTARSGPLFAEFDTIVDLQTKIKTLEAVEAEELQQEIDERTAAFSEQLEVLPAGDSEAFRLRLDDRRSFKNDPPLLYWDRREAEPLKVRPDEFFPQHELCLLDFHPAPLWDVLKQNFPASYDVFEYILATLFIIPTQSVKAGLTALSPGAFEWLVAECPSLTDISKGGSPDLDFMTVRCLTLEMLKEITEAWMNWPFQPHRYELMRKLGSVVYDPDEESVGQQQSISEK